MHTYRKSKDEPLWTVGYFDPQNQARWVALKDFNSEEDAAAYVSYLNGGQGGRL